MNNKLHNHIVLNVDVSSSMEHLVTTMIQKLNELVNEFKSEAKKTKQKTTLSLFTFSHDVKNIFFEADIEDVPKITKDIFTGGNTALYKSMIDSINDLKSVSTKYGNHSFLHYTITDGENNQNPTLIHTLKNTISSLENNWTLTISVPNQRGFEHASGLGISAGNIQIWEQTESGVEKMSKVITNSVSSYYSVRSSGAVSSPNLFTPDTSFTTTDVKKTLEPLKPDEYMLLSVHKKQRIDEFVKSWNKGTYVIGSAYFMLSKPEMVQVYKQILLKEKSSGKIYGGPDVRKMLGLPDYDVKINPATHPRFDIFVQSTSTNRNLVPGTQLIILV